MENKEIVSLTEEVKGLGNQVKEAVANAEKNINLNVDSKINSVKSELIEATKSDVASVAAEVKSIKEEFKSFKAEAGTAFGKTEKKSFNEELKEAVAKASAQYAEKKSNVEISLKTAITGSNFTNDSTGDTRVNQEYREMGINKAPKRTPFIREQAFNGTTTGDLVSWTEKVSESGQPIALAELDAYPEETSSYQQFSTPVKKIGGITKVSEEKLSDVEWMMNEIQAELVQRHDLVVDTQILNGSGSGANLKGVLQYATPFAAGAFALAIATPNRADVLRVAYNQVVTALFIPSFIAMHPTDVTFNDLEKDANGRYIFDMEVDQKKFVRLPVVENTGIAQGSFLIGDGSRLGVFAKGGAVLEIGRDGNDFSTDQVTVKLRERLAVRVKGRDLAAFVSGTFSTAITALTKA